MYEFPCILGVLDIDEFEYKTNDIKIKQNNDGKFSLVFMLEFFMIGKSEPFYSKRYSYGGLEFREIDQKLSDITDLVEEFHYVEQEENG